MGYSGRYHAASLAAVFIALAVGILIGIGLADDVVSSASEEIESSLESDLSASEERVDELESQLDQEQRFSDEALPAVVANRLAGQRVAMIGFGEASEDLVDDARSAVEDAGGDLASVAQIAEPPDTEALSGDLPPRFAAIRRDPDPLAALGREIGEELVGGGPIVEALKPSLFSTFTGNLRGVDRVIVAGAEPPADLEPEERETAAAFEDAVLEGIESSAAAAVGAELTTTDPTALGPFIDAGLPTVDHVDLPAGQVSLVYTLAGLDGNFGVKEAARSYLPDLQRGTSADSAP